MVADAVYYVNESLICQFLLDNLKKKEYTDI